MIYIVAAHLSAGGTRCEHISQVIWVDSRDFGSGKTSVSGMVDYINKNPGLVQVSDGKTKAIVEVVKAAKPYIRSESDASKTDNLLSIPRY